MPTQTETNRLEREADRLLTESGCKDVYSEREMLRRTRKEIAMGVDFLRCDATLVDLSNETYITLKEILDVSTLTTKQREAVELMLVYQKQVDVAKVMGTSKANVCKLLKHAFKRLTSARRSIEQFYPLNNARRLFAEEMLYKYRLVYQKPYKSRNLKKNECISQKMVNISPFFVYSI